MTATSSDEALCVQVIQTNGGHRFAFCGQELVMIPLAVLDPTGGDTLLLARDHPVGTFIFPKEGYEQTLLEYCQSLNGFPVS